MVSSMFFPDGDGFVILGTNGRREPRPAWYHNVNGAPPKPWSRSSAGSDGGALRKHAAPSTLACGMWSLPRCLFY